MSAKTQVSAPFPAPISATASPVPMSNRAASARIEAGRSLGRCGAAGLDCWLTPSAAVFASAAATWLVETAGTVPTPSINNGTATNRMGVSEPMPRSHQRLK